MGGGRDGAPGARHGRCGALGTARYVPTRTRSLMARARRPTKLIPVEKPMRRPLEINSTRHAQCAVCSLLLGALRCAKRLIVKRTGGAMLSSLITRLMRGAPAVVALMLAITPVQADTLVFYASMPGQQTLDRGEGGGNPFASALIEALEAPLIVSDLPLKLRQLTAAKSRGFQSADVPAPVSSNYSLVPARSGEERIALVMVVSNYAASGGAPSLPGARHDADRMAKALQRAGFQAEQALDLDLQAMRAKLAEFGERAQRADAAVIYTTGHGVEVDGTVFLLPGDYPISERNSALSRRALPLPEIARSLRAKQLNMVFYGGCRDNPFGPVSRH